LAVRGDHPGLVHVISAMEACPTCKQNLRAIAAPFNPVNGTPTDTDYGKPSPVPTFPA